MTYNELTGELDDIMNVEHEQTRIKLRGNAPRYQGIEERLKDRIEAKIQDTLNDRIAEIVDAIDIDDMVEGLLLSDYIDERVDDALEAALGLI